MGETKRQIVTTTLIGKKWENDPKEYPILELWVDAKKFKVGDRVVVQIDRVK